MGNYRRQIIGVEITNDFFSPGIYMYFGTNQGAILWLPIAVPEWPDFNGLPNELTIDLGVYTSFAPSPVLSYLCTLSSPLITNQPRCLDQPSPFGMRIHLPITTAPAYVRTSLMGMVNHCLPTSQQGHRGPTHEDSKCLP